MSVIPVEITTFIDDFINGTGAETVDLGKDVKSIIATGVTQARAARYELVKQARYASANKGFTRLSPVLNNGISAASNTYLDTISKVADSALQFAENAQTQQAQSIGSLIPRQLQSVVEIAVNEIELDGRKAVNAIQLETQVGLSDIEIANARAVSVVTKDYKRKVANANADGEIAAKHIEIVKSIETLRDVNVIKVKNQIDVGLIEYSAEFGIQKNLLDKEIEGKLKTTTSRLAASTNMSTAKNAAATNEAKVRYDGSVMVGDARIYAANLLGNSEIDKTREIGGARVAAQEKEHAATVNAFGVTSTAENVSLIDKTNARIESDAQTTQSRIDAMSITDSAEISESGKQIKESIDAMGVRNDAKIVASNTVTNARIKASETELEGITGARKLTRAEELRNDGLENTLRTTLRTESNKKTVAQKGIEFTTRMTAAIDKFSETQKATNTQSREAIRLESLINAEKVKAINTENIAETYAIGKENLGREYTVGREQTSRVAIESKRLTLKQELTNAEVVSKKQIMEEDLNARISSANLRSKERIAANALKNSTSEERAKAVAAANKTAAKERKTAQSAAVTKENDAYNTVLPLELSNRTAIASKEAQERTTAATNEEIAYINFLKGSIDLQLTNDTKLDDARIASTKAIFDAQSKALDKQNDSNDYVQKKQDESRFTIAKNQLAFDLKNRAYELYFNAYIAAQDALSEKQFVENNKTQTHRIKRTEIKE